MYRRNRSWCFLWPRSQPMSSIWKIPSAEDFVTRKFHKLWDICFCSGGSWNVALIKCTLYPYVALPIHFRIHPRPFHTTHKFFKETTHTATGIITACASIFAHIEKTPHTCEAPKRDWSREDLAQATHVVSIYLGPKEIILVGDLQGQECSTCQFCQYRHRS